MKQLVLRGLYDCLFMSALVVAAVLATLAVGM